MASENETVAEIAKRVRRDCNSYPLPSAAAEMLKLVREIEAAHRREVAELRECLKDAIMKECSLLIECADCRAKNCCDMRRWRKALEGAK